MPIKWKHEPRVWIAVERFKVKSIGGKLFKATIALRLDGREGTFRVDMQTLGPWEAIDGGQGFARLEEAKAYAEKWLQAAQGQNTVHPKGVTP